MTWLHRERVSRDILDLLDVAGATSITITLDAVSARELAKDLQWCEKSTERDYMAVVSGSATNARETKND